MASSDQPPGNGTSQELTEAVDRCLWTDVVRLVRSRDGTEEQRHRAVVTMIKSAFHRVVYNHLDDILKICSEVSFNSVLKHLVLRGLWRCVGHVLQRNISRAQRSWMVEEAMKRASDRQLVDFVLPHCTNEELEQGVSHLISHGHWKSLGSVLERGISATQRSWAVVEATKHVEASDFLDHVLPHCSKEDVDQVLTNLVPRPEMWAAVNKALELGGSAQLRSWAVEEAAKRASEKQFFHFILHHCSHEELGLAWEHLVSRGLPELVDSGASATQHILSHILSLGMWRAVSRFLQRDISGELHTWAVEQASRHAADGAFSYHIVPKCSDDDLERVTSHLVARGLWFSVGAVLKRGISTAQHRWAVVEGAKHAADFDLYSILHHCSEDDVVAVFPLLVVNRKTRCIRHVMYGMVQDALYSWMTSGYDNTAPPTAFWRLLHTCKFEEVRAQELTKLVLQERSDYSYHSVSGTSHQLARRVSWQPYLCEALMTALLYTVCCVMCSNDREYTDTTNHTKQCVSDIYTHFTACVRENTDSVQNETLEIFQNRSKWTSILTEIANAHSSDPLFLLHFLQGLNLYHVSRRGKNDDAILLVMFAILPHFPQLQSVALKMMLREKRWDVIRRVCMSHLWEHDRRQLFKAAVEQRQWEVVRQWADHTVLDDQRHWAMKEAFKEEEWEVYLLLADHGLTLRDQMHAHYMVAKYGDWDTVLQLVERGGDITEVSNLLENWVTGRLRMRPVGDATVYLKRCRKLIRLRLRFAQNCVKCPMKALQRCKWGSVLFNILHEPSEDYFLQVLDKVLSEKEWHILMHLVRLGMKADERNWLFPEMVRQQQWGVCRKLLEHGVDIQLCLQALPELMERNQWTLVARVMEYDVDDAVRRQVMLWAFQRRAGELFWHCLTTMKDQQQLPMETREKLFHRAFSRDIWQAVKPLVEDQDDPGIQRRDMAFVEAIEQHLWDVVDYCQPYGADINTKDEKGETPLHREARKEEWKAVEEILFRDAEPNLLDKDGISVLNRAIVHGPLHTVKFLIKYGGNIHMSSANYFGISKRTPLQILIDRRHMDIIHFTILWCPEQRKGINDLGETALHAACDSDRWDVMEDLVVRRVDPLAVTKTGKSPLVYAVLNTQCPHRMVAECCRLGFSRHQPSLTGPQEHLLEHITRVIAKMCSAKFQFTIDRHILMWEGVFTFPLVYAVLLDLPVLATMLYESESCSKSEMLTLCTQLLRLRDRNTEDGKKLYDEVLKEKADMTTIRSCLGSPYSDHTLQNFATMIHIIDKSTELLRELLTTPRTLLSSCRLVILQHFHCQDKKRLQKLNKLPLPVPLKNYLEFSDFRDPDFGRDML